MPSATHTQTNFTTGELSPLARARVDLEQYDNAAATLLNALILPAGGATKRPGSQYIATTKDSVNFAIVRPFIVSSVAAYVIEIGTNYIGSNYARFYRNRAQLLASGSPLELVTPWNANELRQLRFAQSVDELYVFHVSYQPRVIRRTASDTFEIALLELKNGPYVEENTGDVGAAAATPGASGAETGSGGGTATGATGGGGPPEGPVGGGGSEGTGGS